MAVKLINYNILENIFTVLKKISLVAVSCFTVLAFSMPPAALAAPKKPAAVATETKPAAEAKSAADSKPVATEQDSANQPSNTDKEQSSTPDAASDAANNKLVVTTTSTVATKGNPQAGNALTTTCATCHGADGNSPLPIYPKLAGQHESYLLKMLLAYQALKDPASEAATHKSTNAQIMYSQVMNFSQQDLADLAAFFSIQKPTDGETNPASYELGRKIYLGGDLERGIPACAACHSPAGLGNDLADFPKLSGQHSEYIKAQLLAFKNDERINDMMQIVAKKLTEEEMAAVASYASGVH